MRLRVALVTAALVAAVPASAYAGGRPPAQLVVAGAGGQSAVLTVGPSGLDVEYPFFPPRLPGPDGTVSGVVIQDPRGALVGGVLLQNVPGFDEAIAIGLVDFDKTRLRPGRYRLTLLGTGRQSVQLAMPKGPPTRLTASGPARPITRTVGASAGSVATWNDSLGAVGGRDMVLVGYGSGGTLQQADVASDCLYVEGQPCGVPPVGIGLSPGPGSMASWSTQLYAPGSLAPGRYLYSGSQVVAGPASTSGHSAVVIALRR